MWYQDTIINSSVPGTVYSRSQIFDILSGEKGGLTLNSFNWIMDSLLDKNILARTRRNGYILAYGLTEQRMDYAPIFSNSATDLIKIMEQKFPLVDFVCFESVQLNEFLNHLIARNTVFILLDRQITGPIFHSLREGDDRNFLLNPGKKEWDSYWTDNSIVLLNLISEAPKNRCIEHAMSIEQLLVDIISDKCLKSLFSRSELPRIYSEADRIYKVDKARLMRYAKRRGKSDDILKYMEGI